jgi:hypothetical protein
MSSVNSIGGGGGSQGYITDPPSPPEPGDRWLGAPPTPPEEGDRWLGAPPAASSPSARYITDPPTAPAAGDRRLDDPAAAPAAGDRRLDDPRRTGDDKNLLADGVDAPKGRAVRERYITDKPLDPEPGDQWLTAPGGPTAQEPTVRAPTTAGDHALSSINNVGKFFEDVWEAQYGEAVLDAGLAVTSAGSAFYELLFGEDKRTPPPAPKAPKQPDPPLTS